MSATIARTKYCIDMPYNHATPFLEVDFMGAMADEVASKWEILKLEEYRKAEPDLTKYHLDILRCREEIEKNSKIKKPWYRPWFNKEEKKKLRKLSDLKDKLIGLVENKTRLEDYVFDTKKLHRKLEKFLIENGFVIQSANSNGDICAIYTDIWVKENSN